MTPIDAEECLMSGVLPTNRQLIRPQLPLSESDQLIVESTAPSPELPIRIMALHAMMYCERLFYLEEVEEIRVAEH